MSRQVTFVAVPPMPLDGGGFPGLAPLAAVRDNVEILIGARGTQGKAVLRGDITVQAPQAMTLQELSANGASVNVGGVGVPRAEDYFALLRDVQKLAGDVSRLRDTVAALVQQLKP